MGEDAVKQENRLRRQIDALVSGASVPRRPLDVLLGGRMRLLRVPLAILLIVGSFLAILPIFGLWMLPAGLLLLAVDVPALRPRVSAAIIRGRRRLRGWRRRAPGGSAPNRVDEG